MAKALFNDRAYKSYAAEVPANLVGKEGYLVEKVAGKNTIQLYTATNGTPPLGVLFQRLEGDTAWNVRMIGRAATCRMVASGNIPANSQVKGANGGTIVAGNAGDKCIGVTDDGLAHAANDIVEVADSFFVGT